MKPDQFTGQVLMAALLSAVGFGMVSLVSLVLGFSLAMLATIISLTAVWLMWLIYSGRQRRGVTLVFLAWLVLSFCLVLAGASAVVALITVSGLVWLVRSGMRYNRPMRALLDGGVTLIAVGSAIGLAAYGHSLLLAFWCYFFIQTLVFLIPEKSDRHGFQQESSFANASRQAEQALQKMLSQ